jgi:hypothetical protein
MEEESIVFKINYSAQNPYLRIIYLICIAICIYNFHLNPTLFSFIIIYFLLIILLISKDVLIVKENQFEFVQKRIFSFLDTKKIYFYKDIKYINKGCKSEFSISEFFIYFPIIFPLIFLISYIGTGTGYTNRKINIKFNNESEKNILINKHDKTDDLINLLNQNIEKTNNPTI